MDRPPPKKNWTAKRKKKKKSLDPPKQFFLAPLKKIFRPKKKLYRCYYPHQSRDLVSPACGIFQNIRLGHIQTDNFP